MSKIHEIEFARKQTSSKYYDTRIWTKKEGVFKMSTGEYINRVKKNGRLTTLSRHNTKEEAQKAYELFNAL